MKKLIYLFTLLPLFLSAQVFEQFSDGDFTYNPIWTGDTAEFEISTSTIIPAPLRPALRLKAPSGTTGMSYLSTPNTMSITDSVEWTFWVKLSLNPSSNNNARVYLVSDQENVEGSLNGYYVGIGETNDRLTLCRQNGTNYNILITGTQANLNKSSNEVRVKVKKSTSGVWTLYSDTLGGTNFTVEGTATDNSITTTNWFGFYCKYTSSNVNNWFFDDFYAGSIQIDTIPPSINSILALAPTLIDVKFSESVDPTSATTISNYTVDNGIGSPTFAAIDAVDASLVHLSFNYAFTTGQLYNITICNLKDLSNNVLQCETKSFAFYTPKAYDIIINEIMADPDPAVQLPNVEYIELYNRTNLPITLTNWKIYFGTSYKTLPAVTMAPNDYLILSYGNALDTYGNNVPLFTSASTLTNSGTTLMLKNESDQIIHSVTYSSSWYTDASKANGGWSLELVDPFNPCAEESNWKASIDPKGGTPGKVNSVKANNPDNQAPELLRAGVNASQPDRVVVYFSEPLNSASLSNKFKYTISNGIGNPASVIPIGIKYNSAILILPSNMTIQKDVIYKLTVSDSILDCAGNLIPINSSVLFAIPETASYNDIIINEVLSNPPTGGSDYVEVYNRSDKIIDLGTLMIASYDTLSSTIINANNISDEIYLMFPGDYYCLTTDPVAIKKLYYTSNPKGFIKMSSMPSYNNNKGIVVISDKSNTIIDKLTYSASMHFPLLKSTKGVSLERINFNVPTEEKTNWHSASENCGFGTPAYKNSQYTDYTPSDDPITINPEIFSPDNDGHNDVLGITYKFEEVGYMANIIIYDAKGRQVKYLAKNTYLGTEGSFTWNGITDDNEKANVGMYVIYVEVFDLQGKIKHYKKAAVLASKLK
ncbi:MAG TPA: lamin tail domain-containing protein [Bacteroidales bacterium]|nr:lamin tail domain-containing protein [Bacteroidales bacterium]